MTQWDFPSSDPVDISIDSWTSGSIVLSGEPTDTIVVEVIPSRRGAHVTDLLDQVTVAFEDGQLYIRGPRIGAFWRQGSLDLTIKAPAGSSCAAKTASADLSCIGQISALALHTASGDLTAGAVTGDVTVQSASGDIMLDKVGGELTIRTASGDTRATQVHGAARLNTVSGDVTIGYCAGRVTARTVSGDLRLGCVTAGSIEVASSSGDVEVGVVPGIGVYLDLLSNSGGVRSELDEVESTEDATAVVNIMVRTSSGDIRITRSSSGLPDPISAEPADAGQ